MLAWSSLSRTSHFSPAGMMTRRWQAVVLRQRQPVPHRVTRGGAPLGVLAEVAQQVAFRLFIRAAEAAERRLEVVPRLGHAAEGVGGSEALKRRLPRVAVELLVEF